MDDEHAPAEAMCLPLRADVSAEHWTSETPAVRRRLRGHRRSLWPGPGRCRSPLSWCSSPSP